MTKELTQRASMLRYCTCIRTHVPACWDIVRAYAHVPACWDLVRAYAHTSSGILRWCEVRTRDLCRTAKCDARTCVSIQKIKMRARSLYSIYKLLYTHTHTGMQALHGIAQCLWGFLLPRFCQQHMNSHHHFSTFSCWRGGGGADGGGVKSCNGCQKP